MLFGSFARDTVDNIYATLAGGKIDGLILLPTPRSPVMDRLFDSHLPVVAIANAHPTIPSVVVDDHAGSRLLAAYLAKQGHRRILYRSHQDYRTSTVRRLESFLAAAHDLGMAVTVTYEVDTHQLSTEELAILHQPVGQRPTAAVCWMDLNAYQLLNYCDRQSIRVPDDLAIAGFDGIPQRIQPWRALTTICAPWAEVADKAVQMLLALLNGKDLPLETMLPVKLVVGDTT